MDKEKEDIAVCLRLVEEKIGWGSSDAWRASDFEKLSENIFDETGNRLSSTTLRRVWGKLPYAYKPSPFTLTTLALYLGHEDWLSFRASLHESQQQEKKAGISVEKATISLEKTPEVNQSAAETSGNDEGKMMEPKRAFGVVFLFMMLVLFGLSRLENPFRKTESYTLTDLQLEATIGEGIVPFSSYFQYDSSRIASDTSAIAYSRSKAQTYPLTPDRNTFSIIHYIPGLKDIYAEVDGEVTNHLQVLATSDGWMGIVPLEDYTRPQYFDSTDIVDEGGLHVPTQALDAKGIDVHDYFKFYFYHIRRFSGDMSAFDFSTTLRLTEAPFPCEGIEVSLLFEDGYIAVPLVEAGCSAINAVYINQKKLDGRHDKRLVDFVVEKGKWHNLSISYADSELIVRLDDKSILQEPHAADWGQFLGFRYRYRGIGDVQSVKMLDAKGEEVNGF